MDDDATRFSGSIPAHYDSGLGPVIFRHYAEVFAEAIAESRPRRILETAAGTGISSAAIAHHNPDAELVISDLNDAMLEFARAKVPPGTRVEVVDVQHLPFPDASFDVVACQFGIMFVPDLEAAFREARRVLVPTGVFHFSVWDGHAKNRFAAITDGLLAQAFPDDPPPFYRVPFGLSDVNRLRDLAQSTGFGRVRMDVVPHDAPVASWADFADGLIVGNPVADQLRRRSADLDVLVSETAHRLRTEFGEAPTTTPVQTLFFRAYAH
ncbi:class I SAM-dependent methyltransferase [Leifsonia sp. RAF41]|uniref:class I SAM-dependent methyltransferase n=1 Tax=Leifsonia sp. RAF41 TaxID=3233056 RepID=UPI003F9D2497